MSAPEPGELGEWIRRYTPRLLGIARVFASGPDEAEDILQDVWIAAWRQAGARPAGASPGAWLYRVALNTGRARLRRRRRRRKLRELWSGSLRAEGDGTGAPAIEDELRRRGLWRAIARLPRLQREVLLLRMVEGLSTADAAAVLHRAEGTIKASLHRALGSLRAELAAIEPQRSEPEEEPAGQGR